MRMKELNKTFVLQHDASDCGVACLLVNSHGVGAVGLTFGVDAGDGVVVAVEGDRSCAAVFGGEYLCNGVVLWHLEIRWNLAGGDGIGINKKNYSSSRRIIFLP